MSRHTFEQGIAYVLLAYLMGAILLFGGLAIAVRFVSKEEFGIFVLLLVAVDFLIMFADFGITSTVIRFLSAKTIKREEVASTSLGFFLLISLAIFSIIYFLGRVVLLVLHFPALSELTLFIGLLFFFQYHLGEFSAILQGLHLYKRFASVQVVAAITRMLLILFFVKFLHLQLKGLIFAAVASVMLSGFLAYLLIPWHVIPRLNFGVLKKLLAFGFPLQIHNFMGFIFERTDTVMLGAMSGSLSVAAYEVGYKVPNQLRALFVAFRSVFFPHIAEYYGNNNHVAAEALLRNTLRVVSFLSAGATLVAILYGKEIITLLFSSKYADSGAVFATLMVAISFGICNYLMGTALIASGRPKTILLCSIPESLINVAGNLVFIPKWGVMGAACASVISRCAVNPIFVMLLGLQQFSHNSWSYLKSFICLGITCLIFWFLPPLGLWGKGLIVVIFVLLSFIFGVLLLSDFRYFLKISIRQEIMKARGME